MGTTGQSFNPGVEPRSDFEVTTRRWLDARPEELTAVGLEPEQLHSWCSSVFMYGDLVERGAPDGLGMTLRVHTKGYLPHSFFFVAQIVDVIPHRFMRVVVTGDFDGVADITVTPDGAGSRFEMHWRIALKHPWLRHLVRTFRWVFVRNHRWAMRHMCRQVEDEVHRRREPGRRIAAERATFPHNFAVFRAWQRRRTSAARWH